MRRALTLLALLLVAAGAWLGVRGLNAQNHLLQARRFLAQAQVALVAKDVPAARTAVAQAASETGAARRLTSDPVWSLAARVPYAGRTLRTAAGLAAAADDVAARVLPDALLSADQLNPAALRRPDGSVDLALVRTATPGLTRTAIGARDVQRRVAALPSAGVLRPVRRARTDLLEQATTLAEGARKASQGAVLAPALLGEGRLRRWFVLIQQPGESRGTGGLPGAYAVLEARNGRVRVSEQGLIGALPQLPSRPATDLSPDFITRYQPLGAFTFWVNINLSPDLPAVTRSINHSWTSAGRPALDGVITLDPRSLADLLRGSGPVDAGGGISLTPEQVPQFLAVGQYAGLSSESDQSGRKERLQAIARAAVARLVVGGGDIRALLGGLGDALDSGHLLIASLDPKVAPLLAQAGIDGALPSGPAPVAYAVVNNFAGSKLDSWLSRSLTYTAGGCGQALRRSRIELRLRNDPPLDLPPYVRISEAGANNDSRTNRVLTTVYGTRGAGLESATLDGQPLRPGVVTVDGPVLRPGTEAGLPLWDLTLDLAPGVERVLVLNLVEPTAPGAARVPVQALAKDQITRVEVARCG